MSMEFARRAWRRYLADSTEFREISTLKDQAAMIDSAMPNVSTRAGIIDVPKVNSPSILVLPGHLPSDDEYWTLGDLVKVAAEERVGGKRHLRKLQDTCRSIRRKVLASIADAVGLAVELVGRVDVPPSPGMTSTFAATIALESELNDAKVELRAFAVKIIELESPAMKR